MVISSIEQRRGETLLWKLANTSDIEGVASCLLSML